MQLFGYRDGPDPISGYGRERRSRCSWARYHAHRWALEDWFLLFGTDRCLNGSTIPLRIEIDPHYNAVRQWVLAKAHWNLRQSRRLPGIGGNLRGWLANQGNPDRCVGLQTARGSRGEAQIPYGPEAVMDSTVPGNACRLSDLRDALMVVKEWPISGGPQRGALAADGCGAMGPGRVPNSGERGALEREPRALGCRKLAARSCHHAKIGQALADLKIFPLAGGEDRD